MLPLTTICFPCPLKTLPLYSDVRDLSLSSSDVFWGMTIIVKPIMTNTTIYDWGLVGLMSPYPIVSRDTITK